MDAPQQHYLLQTPNHATQLLIVPSQTSYEAPQASRKKSKGLGTPRKACGGCGSGHAFGVGAARADSTDFLVRGGARALTQEQRIQQMNQAAVKDLRTASDALAAELMRGRAAAEEERERHRSEASRLELDLRAAHEKLALLQERLGEEMRSRHDSERQQHARLKEIQRRFKEEHAAKTTAETELAATRAAVANLEAVNESLEAERAKLLDRQGQQQSTVSRLEATVAADSALIAELRARSTTAESKLEVEQSARQELAAQHASASGQLHAALERCTSQASAVAEAEARARAAVARAELAEDDATATRRSLEAEKSNTAELRGSLAQLQSQLTEMQAAYTTGSAVAAVEKSELERVRRQASALVQSEITLREDNARLREEALHAAAEGTARAVAVTALTQERESLQLQLEQLRSSSARELEALRTKLQREGEAREAEVRHKAEEHQSHIKSLQQALDKVQEEADKLRSELATFSHQAEHYQQVFEEHKAMSEEQDAMQAAVQRAESALAVATATHGSQLELWKAEATEVAQAAGKWKQRALLLQEQVDARQAELQQLQSSLSVAEERAASSEAERVRLSEVAHGLDGRLALSYQEATSLRQQLGEAMSASHASGHEADTARSALASRDRQLDALNVRLCQETAKTSALRGELSALSARHVKEMEHNNKMLAEVTASAAHDERERRAAEERERRAVPMQPAAYPPHRSQQQQAWPLLSQPAPSTLKKFQPPPQLHSAVHHDIKAAHPAVPPAVQQSEYGSTLQYTPQTYRLEGKLSPLLSEVDSWLASSPPGPADFPSSAYSQSRSHANQPASPGHHSSASYQQRELQHQQLQHSAQYRQQEQHPLPSAQHPYPQPHAYPSSHSIHSSRATSGIHSSPSLAEEKSWRRQPQPQTAFGNAGGTSETLDRLNALLGTH